MHSLVKLNLMRKESDGYVLNASGQELFGGTHPRNWKRIPIPEEDQLTIKQVVEILNSWSPNLNLNSQSVMLSQDEDISL